MNNNSLILSTFLKQLDECIDDISSVYSEDTRFIKCKRYLEGIKKTNPGLIIKTWKKSITDKYEEKIEAGDIDYFLEKDYAADVSDYSSTIDSTIQDLRKIIRGMSEDNKKVSIKYIQNLCKLSKHYV
jgi:hypothetical protein